MLRCKQSVPLISSTTRHALLKLPGLGALGIGWYQLIFTWQNNKGLIVATIPLRLVYAAVVYEVAVWMVANCAAYL